MIKLLKQFAHGLARNELNIATKCSEKKNKAIDIHKIECMMMEFNESFLVKNNTCVNLVHECVTLNNEKSTIRGKISKLKT